MTLLRYLFIMILATALCWAGVWTVVVYIDPKQTGMIGLSLFYVSLFLALTGTFAVIGFFIRQILLKQELVFQRVIIAFRQAIFFAIIFVGLLILKGAGLFTWYNVILLVVAMTVLEFFSISRRPARYR